MPWPSRTRACTRGSPGRRRRSRCSHEISRDLSSILDLDELLERIGQLLRRLIDYQMFSILLLNERDQVLETQFAVRFGERYVPLERVPLGRGLVGCGGADAGACLRRRMCAQDPRYHMVNPLTRSELAVPLIYKEKVIGVLDMEHTRRQLLQRRPPAHPRHAGRADRHRH